MESHLPEQPSHPCWKLVGSLEKIWRIHCPGFLIRFICMFRGQRIWFGDKMARTINREE